MARRNRWTDIMVRRFHHAVSGKESCQVIPPYTLLKELGIGDKTPVEFYISKKGELVCRKLTEKEYRAALADR